MNQNVIKNVRIIGLSKQKLTFSKLKFRYFTKEHYAVAVFCKTESPKPCLSSKIRVPNVPGIYDVAIEENKKFVR